MYCPTCRYEYREGFYVCSDCNLDLVIKLEEKPPEIIKPSLDVFKASLKRVRISLVITAGLLGILHLYRGISNIYYDLYGAMSNAYYGLFFYDINLPEDSANELLASELSKKLTWINTWIDFIVISCISSLLIYSAYKGLRYIRPYGGASTFIGLTVVIGCALAASAYTIVYLSYRWWRLLPG